MADVEFTVETIRVGADAINDVNAEFDVWKKNIDVTALSTRNVTAEMDEFIKANKKATEQVKAGTKATEEHAKKTDNSAKSIERLIGKYISWGLALKTLWSIGKQSLELAAQHETVVRQLEGTLYSTGRQAEISADQILVWAESLEKVTAFRDDEIIAAYNAIAKFEKIDTSSMERIVKTAADMTAVMGGDLAGNAEKIARIIESGLIPETIAFDSELRKQVRSMVAAGDAGSALTLVLDELNRRYGGQAAAQLEGYTGQVVSLKNAWEETTEAGGKALTQMITESAILPALTNAFTKATEGHDLLNRARAAGLDITKGLLPVMVDGHRVSEKQLLTLIETAEEYNRVSMLAMNFYADVARGAGEAENEQENLNRTMQDYNQYLNDIIKGAEVYASSQERIAKAQADVRAAAAELFALQKAGWGESSRKIQEARDKVEEMNSRLEDARQVGRDATNELIYGFYQAQLMIDGTFDEGDMERLLNYRLAMGLLTEEEYRAAQAALQIAMNLAAIPAEVISRVKIYEERYSTVIQEAQPGSWVDVSGHRVWVPAFAGGGNWSPGEWAVVGDRPGTGWSETAEVITPSGQIIPHEPAQRMKDAGLLNTIPSYANGTGEWVDIGGHMVWIPSTPKETTLPKEYSPPKESTLPVGGGGGGSTQAVAEAAAEEAVEEATGPISEAAEKIARSGSETAKATKQQTAMMSADAATQRDMLNEIRGMRADIRRLQQVIPTAIHDAYQKVVAA